jgi:hypothetical protein
MLAIPVAGIDGNAGGCLEETGIDFPRGCHGKSLEKMQQCSDGRKPNICQSSRRLFPESMDLVLVEDGGQVDKVGPKNRRIEFGGLQIVLDVHTMEP